MQSKHAASNIPPCAITATGTGPAVRCFLTAARITGAPKTEKWSDFDFEFWNLDL
jgi:hypothetical protein